MDKNQRDELVVAFKARQKGDRTNPMLTLLERSSLDTVEALIACCDRYMNFEVRLKARQLTSKEPAFIIKALGDIDRALQHCDSEVCPGEPLRKAAAVPLMMAITEGQGRQQVEQAAFEYLVAMDHSRQTAPTNVWPKSAIKSVERGFDMAARHERRQAMLDDASGREDFLQFLDGCATMAIEIQQSLTKSFDPWEVIAVFLRLHVHDSDKLEEVGRRAAFLQVFEPKVESAADRALKLERELIESGQLAVPRAYVEPFGSVKGLNAQLPMECHSYFASRVALAAVAFDSHFTYSRDIDLMDSMLHELWSYRGANGEVAYHRDQYEDIGTDFAANSDEQRAWAAFKNLGLAREYVVADFWQQSLGYNGVFVNAAHALLSVTAMDHMFLRQVFERLVATRFRNSALIALAGKLGCLYHRLSEPTCARPRPAQGSGNAASHQINLIQQLVGIVAPDHLPDSVPLVAMTKRIYFKDAPLCDEPEGGFDWIFAKIEWASLQSDSHIESGVPGAHLWLYGSHFQGEVDQVIDAIGTASNEGPDPHAWHRLARFIFLVPYIEGSRKRLGDWSLVANRHISIKHQMKTALKRLCGLGRYADVDVYRHLARPILRLEERPSPDNVLFAPQA